MVGLAVIFTGGGVIGLGVYRRGGRVAVTSLVVSSVFGGVGVIRFGVLYLRGGRGVGVIGVGVVYLRSGVGVMEPPVLYLRGGTVGVMRYGVLSARCGRGAGVKIAVLSLRGDRGVVVGVAIASLLDTGSR